MRSTGHSPRSAHPARRNDPTRNTHWEQVGRRTLPTRPERTLRRASRWQTALRAVVASAGNLARSPPAAQAERATEKSTQSQDRTQPRGGVRTALKRAVCSLSGSTVRIVSYAPVQERELKRSGSSLLLNGSGDV